MKSQHISKIKEFKDALVASGVLTLDQQAKALGLARSTTATIVRATHKNSGLSAATINRILRSPILPALVQTKVLEYVKEKSDGLYGHSALQRRRFLARLSVPQLNYVHTDFGVTEGALMPDTELEIAKRKVSELRGRLLHQQSIVFGLRREGGEKLEGATALLNLMLDELIDLEANWGRLVSAS